MLCLTHSSPRVGPSSRFPRHFLITSCRMCSFSRFTQLYVRKAPGKPTEGRTARGAETKEAVPRCSVMPLSGWGAEALSTVSRHALLVLSSSLPASAPLFQSNRRILQVKCLLYQQPELCDSFTHAPELTEPVCQMH